MSRALVRRPKRRPDPRHDEPADDLDPGDDRGREAGDAVGRLVAVQLEEVGLGGVEDVDARAERERGGEHEPADRRVAEAAVDRAPDDRPDRGDRADAALAA